MRPLKGLLRLPGMVGLLALAPSLALASSSAFISSFHNETSVSATVPANGDLNPYGVAVVPRSTGNLVQGDILVSNFNNSANLQGTGTTIVQIQPSGSMSVFAHIDPATAGCPGGVGLTTALAVFRSGWVVVGSLPTTDGTPATIGSGCLLVMNNMGGLVETISGGPINGPWDLASVDGGSSGTLFVTNVLNGTVAAGGAVVDGGTLVSIGLSLPASGMPVVTSEQVLASGFAERTDPAALVVGPTGVGLSADGSTVFVADSVNSQIDAVPSGGGSISIVSSSGALNDPLGLALAPNGDIVTANGADGKFVETTPTGREVATRVVDTLPAHHGPSGAGTLFGLALAPAARGIYFVDDGVNVLKVLS